MGHKESKGVREYWVYLEGEDARVKLVVSVSRTQAQPEQQKKVTILAKVSTRQRSTG